MPKTLLLLSVAPMLLPLALVPAARREETDPAAADAALLAAAESALLERADDLLDAGPWSVTDNDRLPPSGDKRDFMSSGPYWWPDPDQPDGLPYVRRDGEKNPESDLGSDAATFATACRTTLELALAHRSSGEARHAERAGLVLRHFFLDPGTGMNPHLRFGQAIPGRTDGRGIGIIGSRHLVKMVEAAELLEGAPGWSEEDAEGLRRWSDAFLDWLLTSPLGINEANEHNNHGTWYDAQAAALALHAGRTELARSIVEAARERRIEAHVAADGTQPHELERTRSWNYVNFNLEGLAVLADLGERVGVDLWNADPPAAAGGDTPLLKRAVDALVPWADPALAWPHPQIVPDDRRDLHPILVRARRAYGGYEDALAACSDPTDLTALRLAASAAASDPPR